MGVGAPGPLGPRGARSGQPACWEPLCGLGSRMRASTPAPLLATVCCRAVSGNVGPGRLPPSGARASPCAPSPRPQACALLLPISGVSRGHLYWTTRNSSRTLCPAAPLRVAVVTCGSGEASALEAGPEPQRRAGSSWQGARLLRVTGPRARGLEVWGGQRAC